MRDRILGAGVRNEERRAKIYEHYRTAYGADADRARTAVAELRAIVLEDCGPILGRPHLNPKITRRYALEALGWLALAGWPIDRDRPECLAHPGLGPPLPIEDVFLTASTDDRIG